MMIKKGILILSSILFSLGFVLSLYFFYPDKDIKIGFIADLSGRQSQLGISVRNGFLMAIDEINENDGILKHKIIPLIKDNGNDPKICFEKSSQLESEKVDLIIGPLTSAMIKSVLNGAPETLVISPTVSTEAVSRIDDLFFRIIPSAKNQGSKLATEIINQKLNNIAIILDSRNIEYSGDFKKGFIDKIESDHFTQPFILNFSHKSEFPIMAEQLSVLDLNALVFVASGIDTAAIVQQYSKLSPLPALFASSWSRGSNVHQYGGKTVEGMILVSGYQNKNLTDKELRFNKRYVDLYLTTPNFAAQYAYEAVMIYKAAVEETGSFDKYDVKRGLLNLEIFRGISDDYKFDNYGDVIRNQSLYIIKNHKYEIY